MSFANFSFILAFVISGLTNASDSEYHLLEEQSPRTFIGNIADDAGLRSILNASEFYRLQFAILKEGNAYADWFSLDNKIGQLETTVKIDRESVCASLQICILGLDVVIYKEGQDKGLDLFKAFRISIFLDDLNDNNPTFPKSELILSLPESSEIGYILFISTASDLDCGDKNGVQDYKLVAEDDTFGLQSPGNNGGNLGIVVNRTLNREKKDFYRLQVIAKDGGNPPRSGIVMINVTVLDTNDNAPIFQYPEYTQSIPENQPVGTVVLKVTAVDADIGENGNVMYRFSSRASKATDAFDIKPKSGEIVVKNVIDYEKDKDFQFAVEAYDQGASPKSSQTMIRIKITDENDNSPQIYISLPPGGSSISESSEVGLYVAYLEAKDPDSGENGSVSCSLRNDFFKLEALSAGIYKINLGHLLDRELSQSQNITIICSDNGNPKKTNTSWLLINITDVNDNFPVFSQTVYNFSIQENNQIGDIVAVMTATDNDLGENGHVTYHIENYLENSYFNIDPNSGLISANVIFDRELRSFYQFFVIAQDSGQTILSSTATVRVSIADDNDNSPTFSNDPFIFYVQEGLQLGSEVGNITITDLDIGENGHVSLLQDFPYTNVFLIDSTSGKITTKIALDRESHSIYIFELTARDNGNPTRTSTARIEIHVTDINDNPPFIIFPTNSNNSVYVSLTTEVGTIITKIIAKDSDEGVNAELVYHIIQSDVRQLFNLNNLTGAMKVVKKIDKDDVGTYTIPIAVQDKGFPQLTTLTNLVIIVQDDDRQKNMIIAIAVATVTFALSVAMVLTICVIRRRDVLKENAKEIEIKSKKDSFISGWLTCLSSTTKDTQNINLPDRVKDTNKQVDFTRGTDLQPIVPDNGSTSSDEGKTIDPKSNCNLSRTYNNIIEISERDHDSGFSDSLERRGFQELKGLQIGPNRFNTTYLDSRGIRIPSPYLETSLPNWKKNERPSYNRNISFDEEVFRERERDRTKTFLNHRSVSDSGQNQVIAVSEQFSSSLRKPYEFHSLQRNPKNISNNDTGIHAKYSFRNASGRTLPTISATPEPEVIDPHHFEAVSYNNYSYLSDKQSQSDSNINISLRSETYAHSPRSETYACSPSSETYINSSRSDSFNPRYDKTSRHNSGSRVILSDVLNKDIVV